MIATNGVKNHGVGLSTALHINLTQHSARQSTSLIPGLSEKSTKTSATLVSRSRSLTPNDELWACHRLTIIEDSQAFDSATIEDVRSHFESWVEGQGQRDKWNKYRVCMVIDEETLQLLNEVPSAEGHAEMHGLYCVKEVKEWYVKVIEAFPDPEETEGVEEYEGWTDCLIYALVRLWHSMDDAINMVVIFCNTEDGVFSS
jgi:hypothetical protein